jgi:hypothetical protein
VAAALAALGDDAGDPEAGHFLGVSAGADGDHRVDAGVVEAGDHLGRRWPGKRRNRHAALLHQAQPLVQIGLDRKQVDAERGVCGGRNAGDGVVELVEGHRRRGEDAEPARIGRRCGERGTAHPTHAGLHHRQAYADQLAEPCGQRSVRAVWHLTHSGRGP